MALGAVASNSDKEYNYCLRCGKKLKTAETRAVGMGKTCLAKMQRKQQRNKLFEKFSK